MKKRTKTDMKVEVKEMQFANSVLLPEIVKLLEEGHTVTSMRPFLEDGRDKALLVKAGGNPAVGAPVLAEIAPKHFVLHRIIDIQGDKITLMGDGNLSTEHCRASDIKADIIGFYRKGRKELDRTDGQKWKTYSKIWMALTPIRRYLLAFYRRIWLKLFKPI